MQHNIEWACSYLKISQIEIWVCTRHTGRTNDNFSICSFYQTGPWLSLREICSISAYFRISVPGSRRIDPELVACITDEKLFTSSIISHFPEDLKKISDRKTKLQSYVFDDLHSPASAKLISTLLGHYVKSPEILSESPMIVAGSFRKVPAQILFVNGGWVMPDGHLLNFISEARKAGRLAVVIAKKIHGILFPFFKPIGVVGANTYKTYVSGRTYRGCKKLEKEFSQGQENISTNVP
jgi:hypothetical protein